MNCKLINENFKENYVENLLAARGVKNVKDFFNPTDNYLQEPDDLENIEAGATLYLKNIKKDNSNVLVIVDPDMDGFTSAAILYQYTKKINPNIKIQYFLHEGKAHGLEEHINRIIEESIQYDLILLPDSSSNDIKYHNLLKNINIPCLVLDHHLTDEDLSDNAIIINNQLSPLYKNKELTGAGIVYQFCHYLDKKLNVNYADNYIDLAAAGIIGDMGSVIEMENRFIIKKGLSNINNVFLKTLLEKQAYSITGKMNASWEEILNKTNPISIAFYIVPLINALIRVGSMEDKELMFQAFIDGEKLVPCNKRGAKGTLEKACIEATRVCLNAKSHQNKLKEEISIKLENKIFKEDLLSNKVLFIKLDNYDIFPSELNGLICTQLAAKYKKPTIVARLNNEGYIRGSARGLNQSKLKDFKYFMTNSGLFEYAQGHAQACGCSIPNKNLEAFIKYANEELKDYNFDENVYNINFIRNSNDSDLKVLILSLSSVDGIWGQNNDEPLIFIKDLHLSQSDISIIGKNKDTLRFEKNGITYIKFKAKEIIEKLSTMGADLRIEIVGKANLNEWCGRTTPQILIEDIEFKNDSILDF